MICWQNLVLIKSALLMATCLLRSAPSGICRGDHPLKELSSFPQECRLGLSATRMKKLRRDSVCRLLLVCDVWLCCIFSPVRDISAILRHSGASVVLDITVKCEVLRWRNSDQCFRIRNIHARVLYFASHFFEIVADVKFSRYRYVCQHCGCW